MTKPARVPAIDAFIARWHTASGSERANYQLFVGELCDLLGVPKPDPARDDTRDNAYVFERRVQFAHGDGRNWQSYNAEPGYGDHRLLQSQTRAR